MELFAYFLVDREAGHTNNSIKEDWVPVGFRSNERHREWVLNAEGY